MCSSRIRRSFARASSRSPGEPVPWARKCISWSVRTHSTRGQLLPRRRAAALALRLPRSSEHARDWVDGGLRRPAWAVGDAFRSRGWRRLRGCFDLGKTPHRHRQVACASRGLVARCHHHVRRNQLPAPRRRGTGRTGVPGGCALGQWLGRELDLPVCHRGQVGRLRGRERARLSGRARR